MGAVDSMEGEAPETDAKKKAREDKQAEADKIRKLHGYDRKEKSDPNRPHDFWDTQPVPKFDAADPTSSEEGPMEEKHVDEVQKEPYALPNDFYWVSMEVTDEEELKEIYTLLYENYVEDDDNMFRFDYSREFLQWALMPPGYHKDWHVGVRMKSKKPGKKDKLVAFITGIPADVAVQTASRGRHQQIMCEVNFLCCWKKLRGKRLAPMLIKEVTRRVNVLDVWQAVYTAGIELPKPISTCRYYHRSLNPKKLISVGFSRLAPRMTMKMTQKLYAVPKEPQLKGIRTMEMKDTESACDLLNDYLSKFSLHPVFSLAEFQYWMMPREGVINTYVITDESGKVTDLCGFYTLPSTIIGNPEYNTLKAAYSYYNVASTVSLDDLMYDALILAKQLDFDVFNALDLMDNASFIEKLKFGIGDGNLQYYLYNFRAPSFNPNQTGLVLL